MLQLNLLPDVKKEFLKAQRQRSLVMTISIIASVAAGGIVVILGLVMGGQLVQKNLTTNKINEHVATIEKAQEDKQLNEYLTIQNQLSRIDNLKESQAMYSRLFDYLKQLNPASPNNVELNSVIISSLGDGAEAEFAGGNTIELQGTVANFEALDVYKTTLSLTTATYSEGGKSDKDDKGDSVKEPVFSAITVRDAGLLQTDNGEMKVSFTINVVYNPAIFNINNADVTLKVPQETTSDADRNAPSSIFNGKPTNNKEEDSQNE